MDYLDYKAKRHFSKTVKSLVNAVNGHGSKRALSRENERSIEESVAHIVTSLCNLYMGNIIHLKEMTLHLYMVVQKSQALFGQGCGQIRHDAGVV